MPGKLKKTNDMSRLGSNLVSEATGPCVTRGPVPSSVSKLSSETQYSVFRNSLISSEAA